METVHVDIIFERITEGYYNTSTHYLQMILQILIDIDDDSIADFNVEQQLVQYINLLTEHQTIILSDFPNQLMGIDEALLHQLKNSLPEKSTNPWSQYLINAIHGFNDEEQIQAADINIHEPFLYSDIFIILFNARRFQPGGEEDLFIEAVMSDDFHMFHAFVSENVNYIGLRNYYNDSLLHLAAAKGSITILNYLIQAGLDLDHLNVFQYTPIFSAYLYDHVEAFKMLLVSGANLSIKNDDQITITELAIIQNKLDIVKLILNHRPPKEAGITIDPYILAMNNQAMDVFHYLKSVQYPPLLKKEDHFLVACKNGLKEIVLDFINQGLSINLVYKKRTPLLLAVAGGQYEMVAYLLSKGTNPNPTAKSPLLLAVREGNKEIVELLIQHGANPFEQGKKQLTPLMMAVYYGHLPLVKYFLEYGIDVNQVGYGKFTPLAVAAEMGQYDIAAYLLEKGATVVPKTRSPLSLAIQFGKKDVLELLLEHGFVFDKHVLNYSEINTIVSQAQQRNTSWLDHALSLELKDKNNRTVREQTMASFQKSQQVYKFSSIFFIFFATIFFVISIWYFTRFFNYTMNTNTTVATITELNEDTKEVTYVYTIKDDSIQVQNKVSDDVFKTIQENDELAIYYKTNQVNDAVLAAQRKDDAMSAFVLLMPTLLFVFFSFIIYLHKRSQKRLVYSRIEYLAHVQTLE